MTTLLIIIYVCFICLGLPDSLLGASWPAMHAALPAPMAYAGILSAIATCATVTSSLMSARLIRRFGACIVTTVSVGMTALALVGTGTAHSFALLCVWAIPLGLGAGSVDAALNNFVAMHYAARHMNWLHCFWGVGASAGPCVVALCLARWGSWNMGYLTVALIQTILTVVLIAYVPKWRKREVQMDREVDAKVKARPLSLFGALRLPGGVQTMMGFFCYCALELTAGLWCGSYAVAEYGVTDQVAASWTSAYYAGITLGRLASGFAAIRMRGKDLIRLGQAAIGVGAVIMLLPLPAIKIPMAMCVIGIGCAPIFPGMLHRTPSVFGAALSQSMMGIQMACAYIGNAVMPLLFGAISGAGGMRLLPAYLLLLLLGMTMGTEWASRNADGGK